MFTRDTINYGRLQYNNCSVFVYENYNNRRALMLPCGNVLEARWVGQTVQVKMSTGWTYVYDGFGSYRERYPS